jgi:hypothetical protein
MLYLPYDNGVPVAVQAMAAAVGPHPNEAVADTLLTQSIIISNVPGKNFSSTQCDSQFCVQVQDIETINGVWNTTFTNTFTTLKSSTSYFDVLPERLGAE